MLYYALMFFWVAVIAALFGFGVLAAGAVAVAKILSLILLVLFVLCLLVRIVLASAEHFRRGP